MPPIIPTKIAIEKDEGPLTIEITSGFTSLGSYVLGFIRKGDPGFVEFGQDPKRIDDDVQDIHLIPIDAAALKDHFISVIGKYSPAPGKRQIAVQYDFVQNKKVVHSEAIEENLPEDQEFIRTNHLYTFTEVQ